MKNNEEMNRISLSSWNYGSFYSMNPYYQQRSLNDNNDDNNKAGRNANNIVKIVKREYFDNLPYKNYINRDLYLKNEFKLNLEQKRFESLKMIKENGKTFEKWKSQKNFKIGKEKLNPKEQQNLKNTENHNDMRMTFNQWIKEKNKIKKMEEEKRIKNEQKLKGIEDEINKRRKAQMKKRKKEISVLIKIRREIEKKMEEDAKLWE